MNHVALLPQSEELEQKVTGRYYTGFQVCELICEKMLQVIPESRHIRICDPFSGDGRLAFKLIELISYKSKFDISFELDLFDISDKGFKSSREKLEELHLKNINISLNQKRVDSFEFFSGVNNIYDIVVTNPPWENIKPDRRELEHLDSIIAKDEYKIALRKYDDYLISYYKCSSPKRRFAGWGLNLSRVGAELSMNIVRDNGLIGIILPASFYADDQSGMLRNKLYRNFDVKFLGYIPAEAKQFESADVSASFMYAIKGGDTNNVKLGLYDKNLSIDHEGFVDVNQNEDCSVPISMGPRSVKLLKKIKNKGQLFSDLERKEVWSGREIDETGSVNWLVSESSDNFPPFMKGRFVNRYSFIDSDLYVNKVGYCPSESVKYHRIVWRDVSRASQKRRMIATLLPPGYICGNSLGVVYVKDDCLSKVKWLLAVFNSTTFEFQLRCYLATGHVSLSSIRKVCIPTGLGELSNKLDSMVSSLLNRYDEETEMEVDAYVARELYQLNLEEYESILSSFSKLTKQEIEKMRFYYEKCL
ncbi:MULTISPECIES: Alw26I/Eco31I/Esp3I family type II restriction adenine-specific DNA-methyltransferase [Vibrio harveyi group]|uniref:Alw26I/Eco31I/Esp3I family type II restriction adenine-specific DNA-methyltransferase n=1 Tax=Vibrio harveyi group TaxID=717610 RepID=UPI00041A0888|nr:MULTISPECIES: Alw26I/Eco31I/Esp3I family type II restriction adenine-specific DNA-methyltransferase [Vibrio harveyi group]MCG6238980.1 Alw26I/Eco31I/Esp3I family type II restriction adenine-specific DNA-methyltransferase [Vibrio diabolicus]MDZ5179396.1 Alw26I/Eco31I/Esp3I family type II restriction adenine-specific DNA-methyltransferase [Vibrio parahaemolyticus]